MIVTHDGPKVVELGARLGGDCITTHLVPLSTGIDMIKNCIRIALGERPDIAPMIRMGSAIRYMDSHHGIFKAIAGLEEAEQLEGIVQVCVVKKIGTRIPEITSSADRIGFVIAQARTADQAVMICEKALGLIKITIE
jgi:biotin carboxylase